MDGRQLLGGRWLAGANLAKTVRGELLLQEHRAIDAVVASG
jgi:hypothetical protein